MQAGRGAGGTTPVDLTCKCLRECVWVCQIECVCVMLARAFFCAMLFAVDAVAAVGAASAGAVDVVAVC